MIRYAAFSPLMMAPGLTPALPDVIGSPVADAAVLYEVARSAARLTLITKMLIARFSAADISLSFVIFSPHS